MTLGKSPRDRGFWIYLLSLLLPVALYNLTLKILRLATVDAAATPSLGFALLGSDLLFNFGMVFLWIGAAALAWRAHRSRRLVLGLAHLFVLLDVLVTTAAHRYFEATGTVLDFGLLRFAAEHFEEVRGAMASETPWLLYGMVAAYVSVGPLLISRLVGSSSGAEQKTPAVPFGGGAASSALGVVLCAAAFFIIPPAGNRPLARDPLVQLTVTAARPTLDTISETDGREELSPEPSLSRVRPSAIRNVVIIILESTGAAVTTPYTPSLHTTPFLAELAPHGLLVERAYTTIPHTSKALISILCGVEPRPTRAIIETLPGLVPATCLPELLAEQGYDTVFFQSATERFETRRKLVDNFGFEDFYPREAMPSKGFEPANYFGFEDAVMLGPSRSWLEAHGDRPFLATYLANTPHHDYRAPKRYGIVSFLPDDEHNRYLNAVRYLDFFVRELTDQYRDLGHDQDTLFVILGDHGEAFGEHHRRVHDDVLYEEVLRVPLLFYGPLDSLAKRRVPGPASTMDILPTTLELLGFEMDGGDVSGHSLLAADSARRLRFSCFNDRRCLGELDGWRKYIHYYGQQPDEVYDLAEDPLETHNLAPEIGPQIDHLRAGVLRWAAELRGRYRRHHREELARFVSTTPPALTHERRASFGGRLTLLGYDVSRTPATPGEALQVSYYFHVDRRIPKGWRIVTEAEGDPAAAGGIETADIGHRPLNGLYRLRYWRPGEFVTDVQTIQIPPTWRSEAFNLYMSFLDKRSEKLVPLQTDASADGARVLVASIPVSGGRAANAGSAPSPRRRSQGAEGQERRSP